MPQDVVSRHQATVLVRDEVLQERSKGHDFCFSPGDFRVPVFVLEFVCLVCLVVCLFEFLLKPDLRFK